MQATSNKRRLSSHQGRLRASVQCAREAGKEPLTAGPPQLGDIVRLSGVRQLGQRALPRGAGSLVK